MANQFAPWDEESGQLSLVRSKQRVADHGEVFTPDWLVQAMLDQVGDETERIDSRFLEPACGSGNFIVPVLRRKLRSVEQKFGKSDFEKRHYALVAVMSIYGIELLADNIAECRANMLEVLVDQLAISEDDDLHGKLFPVENLDGRRLLPVAAVDTGEVRERIATRERRAKSVKVIAEHQGIPEGAGLGGTTTSWPTR